jgi:hypothetical protein
MASATFRIAGSSGSRTTTATAKGATWTGQTIPASSWWLSTMAAMARSIPIP